MAAVSSRTALLAAGASAALGIALLLVFLRRYEDHVSGGPPVLILVATKDIALNALLTADALGVRSVPQRYVENRQVTSSDTRRVIGIRLSNGVKAGESILWSDLATTTQERRDLSSLVRSGMRAMTVEADATSSFGGLLRPGDRVDVLLTTDTDRGNRKTTVLLQNLLVLAAGRDLGRLTDQDDRRPERVTNVTLAVTLQYAQVLATAAEQGRITLALRNPDDIAVVDSLPPTSAAELFGPAIRTEPSQAESTSGRAIERVR